MAYPRGFIALWYGAIADIPYGWQLCDGTNGTPDLRDRFVIGAGTTYNPGDSGGSTSHTHTFLSDGHDHDIDIGADVESGTGYAETTQSATDTGTTDPASSLPPYHSLCYVFKL